MHGGSTTITLGLMVSSGTLPLQNLPDSGTPKGAWDTRILPRRTAPEWRAAHVPQPYHKRCYRGRLTIESKEMLCAYLEVHCAGH